MKAALVGPCYRGQFKAKDFDLLIGVDGGIRALKNQKPDLVIGDWDSVDIRLAQKFASKGARLVVLPPRKNQSDLAAALEQLKNRSVTELALFGFTGKRPDHHISNLLEITRFVATHSSKARFQKVAAFGPEGGYHFITHSQPAFRLKVKPGTLISVFSMRERAKGVSMKGFEYNLRGEDLVPGSRGLSNIARSSTVEIRVRQGNLLVVVPSAR